jgi:predicted phosphate transport protein (TIGR00153 family)
MRIPFLSMFITSPFAGLEEHAQKLKECVWAFQQAMECYIEEKCHNFDPLKADVHKLESEADAIKRRIRGHIPKGTWMLVDKFSLFRYLREQDSILDSVEDAVDLISYRPEPGIPKELVTDFRLLVDGIIEPVEQLTTVVSEAKTYFDTFSEKQRTLVKEIIHKIREGEHEADKLEANIKRKAYNLDADPVCIFHMLRLAETIGKIADHAENAGDMMRAMMAR